MTAEKIIRLLIVEDDEDDYFLLSSSLKETSVKKNITWANSYNKAVQLLDSNSYDLVIIDYRLGSRNGIELVSHINDRFPFTPTILLTGIRTDALDEEALKSGVYDYLVKDQYTAESLDRSIRYSVEKSRVLKSLKESENKFKNLFENAVEYVFLVDEKLNVIDANKAALKLFNCDRKEDVIGKCISGYITPNIFTISEFLHPSIEIKFSIPELHKECFCILNVSAVDIEKNIRQLVLHDITERIRNEEKEKLLEKQALTGKVARIIAHEIKNPLTNINLSLLELRTLLSDIQLGNGQESPEEFLSIIDRNGKRINTLIDDLLNATRFDVMTMQEVHIDEVLSETLALIQDRIKLKDIRVEKEIHKDVTIKGDKEKLVIALLNILVNAVEAITDKAGRLRVITAPQAGFVDIIIIDNGKGIPQENMGKLFEPFFTSKKGGTGLGLTATYNIITKHDGAVRVSSESGKGTSFVVTLPVLS